MSKKILSIIPKELHEDLINEVKELLVESGAKIILPDDKKPQEEIEDDIKKWAERNKSN